MSQNPEAAKGCGVLFLVSLWFGIGGAVPFSWTWYIVLSMVILGIGYFIWRGYSSNINPEAPEAIQISGGLLTIMLVIVLLARACGGCGSETGSSSLGEGEAVSYARQFVKRDLTSPSTADFQSTYSMKVEELETNIWFVKGYVDSQNAYGATIRTNFGCFMTYHPKTDNVTLDDIIYD